MAAFESGSAGFAAYTFGIGKLFTLGSALTGAFLMAIFRPPKTRKEMFYQGAVALGCSFLFGDAAVQLVASYIQNGVNAIAIHGLVGALSWGGFGGLAAFRDKLGAKPIDETIKDELKS